jgi:hypothetical protein
MRKRIARGGAAGSVLIAVRLEQTLLERKADELGAGRIRSFCMTCARCVTAVRTEM